MVTMQNSFRSFRNRSGFSPFLLVYLILVAQILLPIYRSAPVVLARPDGAGRGDHLPWF